MSRIYRREELSKLLDVRSEVIAYRLFRERIVYKDWPTETEIIITITQHRNPIVARDRWRVLGITPWAWRYTPLTDTSKPNFTLILNRDAKYDIVGRTKDGFSFRIESEADRFKYKRYFSDFAEEIEWFERGAYGHYVPSEPVVPHFNVLRPQYEFTPITQRPEQIHELVSEANIYFPRNPRTKDGQIRTVPIQGHGDSDLKRQVNGYRRSQRKNRRSPTWMGREYKGSEYTITSNGNGHIIRSVEGEYQFEIIPESDPASNITPAYNFEFTSTSDTYRRELGVPYDWPRDIVRLYVHHTWAVKVKKYVDESEYIDAKVLVRSGEPSQIGFLGEPIKDKNKYKELEENGNIAANLIFGLFSMSLLLIPGWGWVAALALSVGELVYVYNTGRDFFGDKISPKDLAVMGILCIAGIAADAVSAFRALKAIGLSVADDFDTAFQAAFRQLSHEYQGAAKGSLEAIESVGEHPVAKLIASLDEKLQKQLIDAANDLRSTDDYLRTISRLLDEQLRSLGASNLPKDIEKYEVIFRSLLEELLTPDGKTFATKFLRDSYEKFFANRRRIHYRSPLVWLHSQGSGSVIEFLEKALGKGYASRVRDALKVAKGKRITIATRENISLVYKAYDTIVGLGLRPYKELRDEWNKPIYDNIRSLMHDCFELEHPLELRFARNLTGVKIMKIHPETKKVSWVNEWNPMGIDVRDEFLAFLVPRTIRHAALLAEAPSGELKLLSALRYTQHPKTGRVRSLIPHGAEHLATPQEIADAVCTEILRLNFDKIGMPGEISKIMDNLDNDFSLLTHLINTARSTDYKVPYLIRSLDEVDPAVVPGGKGWPQFSKDSKSGVWSIVNPDEVEGARAARQEWINKQKKNE